MAIGLGKMFGFHFPENFNYPYISRSVSEFWRRWHISLGTWFRDYVYIPLGGSRTESKGRLVWNLFVVWILTGIWHGANWTFIAWGLMYFVLISLEKLTGFEKRRIPSAVRLLYTLFFVVLGWVFFRANSIADGVRFAGNMFGIGSTGLTDVNFAVYLRENLWYLVFGILFSMPIAQKFSVWMRQKEDDPVGKTAALSVLYSAVLMAGLLLSLAYLIKGAYNPFIYFNF